MVLACIAHPPRRMNDAGLEFGCGDHRPHPSEEIVSFVAKGSKAIGDDAVAGSSGWHFLLCLGEY